jgi:hypothetical protein
MNIVAIYNLGKDEDRLSKALAAAVGRTEYEARSRLRVPKGGPSVVAVFQDPEKAEDCAVKLRTTGFDAVILTHDEIESDKACFPVKAFEFTAQSLNGESCEKQNMILPYHDIRLILCGMGIVVNEETETVKERKFSMGRALMTSGLVMTKSTSREIRTVEESRERFFYIYAAGRQAVVFRENLLLYETLGKALQPSRAANFNYVVSKLRTQCPDALFDDRLLNRATQAQMLGPSFNPEEHLYLAVSLLAKVLKGT